MTVMNPFLDEHSATFVDLMLSLSTPTRAANTPGPDYLWQAESFRSKIELEEVKDRIPTLPHLFNLPRDLAHFASIYTSTRQSTLSDKIVPSDSSSAAIEAACRRLQEAAIVCLQHQRDQLLYSQPSHTAATVRSQFLPSDKRSVASSDLFSEPAATSSAVSHRSVTPPPSLNLLRSTGSSSGRRHRAQTVSSTPTRMLRRSPSSDAGVHSRESSQGDELESLSMSTRAIVAERPISATLQPEPTSISELFGQLRKSNDSTTSFRSSQDSETRAQYSTVISAGEGSQKVKSRVGKLFRK